MAAAPLTFAGDPLDRAGERRSDAAWVAKQLAKPDTLLLPLHKGEVLFEPGPQGSQLVYVPRQVYRAGVATSLFEPDPERTAFLGLWQSTAVFAVDLDDTAPVQGFTRFSQFGELRQLAPSLPPVEAAIAGRARALFEWRRRHRFCSNCGAPTEVADAGWKRVCPACAAEHFPRTDPVAIMLAVRGDRCLLGRSPRFQARMFSALAGFVEPGESLEEACARELFEEAGVKATSVRYLFSQPWPFPHSLMMGLIAEVEDGETRAQPGEIEELRWFTRAQARQLCAGEAVDGCTAPPPVAIAHHLLKAWSEEG